MGNSLCRPISHQSPSTSASSRTFHIPSTNSCHFNQDVSSLTQLQSNEEQIYYKYIEEQRQKWEHRSQMKRINRKSQPSIEFVRKKLKKVYPQCPDEDLMSYEQRISNLTMNHSYPDLFESTFLKEHFSEHIDLISQLEQRITAMTSHDNSTTVDIDSLMSIVDQLIKEELPVRLLVRKLNPVQGFVISFKREVASTVNGLFKFGRYGMVHTALQVGPIVLDWDIPSLISPHFNYSDIVASLDINSLQMEQHGIIRNMFSTFKDYSRRLFNIITFGYFIQQTNKKKLRIIAEFCTTWNRTKKYEPISRNCQHFVDELLTALNFDPKILYRSSFGPFLRNIRLGKFEMSWNEHTFKSHSQLDLLLHQLIIDGKWNELNAESKMLLKAYHDTYLTRFLFHLHQPNIRDNHEHSFMYDLPSMQCGCIEFFKDGSSIKPLPINSIHRLVQDAQLLNKCFPSEMSVLRHNRLVAVDRTQLRSQNGRGIRILVLDGGDFRGVVQGLCLDYLCKRGLRSVIGSFDLICGTSAGGLIALYTVYGAGRCENVVLEDRNERELHDTPFIIKMTETLSAKVFSNIRLNDTSANDFVQCTSMSTLKLEDELSQYFKGAIMSETDHPKCFVVTNRRCDNQNIKVLLNNYYHNSMCEDNDIITRSDYTTAAAAARITISSPLLFPAVSHDNSDCYEDGSIHGSSLVRQAVQEAKKIWPNRHIDAIVSLGTGRLSSNLVQQPGSSQNIYKQYVHQMTQFATDAHNQWVFFEQENITSTQPIEQLLRLDVELNHESQLFESNATTIAELRSLTQIMFESRVADINHMITFLNND